MKFGKNKKIIRPIICYGVSLICTTLVALLLLLISSIFIAKTAISESASSFMVIATYAISSMSGSILFCVLTKLKGILCGGIVGIGTCLIKLIINQFSINAFQLATYGCILIVCVVAGIMTANVLSNKETKY